jgi:hypothetical protein
MKNTPGPLGVKDLTLSIDVIHDNAKMGLKTIS